MTGRTALTWYCRRLQGLGARLAALLLSFWLRLLAFFGISSARDDFAAPAAV